MSNVSKILYFIMDALFNVLMCFIFAYAGMNGYLYFFQRKILYHPAEQMASPENYGMYDTQLLRLKTSDNNETLAWFTPPKNNKRVMVYFHGNAGNLADRAEKLKTFIKNSNGYGQMAISWRGYGGSEGAPTEEGLYNDARAAIAYLLDNGYKIEDVFLYGESLGTGVAIQMAMEYKVKAIILEAPYTSVANRGAELYPYIPVRLLLKDKFSSIDKIGNVHIPVMIFHGYLDSVMPIHHGRRMLEAANEPKEARFFENIGHTDFNFNEISKITYDFVERFD